MNIACKLTKLKQKIIIISKQKKNVHASDQGVNTMALEIESISLKQNFSTTTTNFKYY